MGPHRHKHRLVLRGIQPLRHISEPSLSAKIHPFGDPCGNRTRVTGVRGRCLDRLTNGPCTACPALRAGARSARRPFMGLVSPMCPDWCRFRDPAFGWNSTRCAFGTFPCSACPGFARRGFADGRSKGCRPLDPAWYRLRRFWILKRYAFGMGRPSRASPEAASPTAVHGACQPHVPRLVSLPRPSLRLELYKVCLRHIPLLGLPRSCLAAGLVRHQGLEPGTR